MARTRGPFSMYDVKNGEGSPDDGPFQQQIQNAANRGAPYLIVGPSADGLYQQELPPDMAYAARWNNIQTWLDFDPNADVQALPVYIRLTETQYNTEDVPAFMPNSTVDDGGGPRQLKWFEWRSPTHYHWKSESTSVYAVPSTSWGIHVDCRELSQLTYPKLLQREWDDTMQSLPPGDVVAWPQDEISAGTTANMTAPEPAPEPAPESIVKKARNLFTKGNPDASED